MNVDEFLGFYFSGVNADSDTEAVSIGGDSRKSDGKINFHMRRWSPGREAAPATQLYFCCSSVKVKSARQRGARRQLTDLVKTYVIVLDDVGTAPHSKVHPDVVKVAPTTTLETSQDNHQYLYKLEHGVDPGEAAALLEALGNAGWTDMSSTDAAHVFRLPGAVNEPRGRFVARVVEHHPERVWSLARLTVELARHGVVVGAARPIADELPPLAEDESDWIWDRVNEEADNLVLGPAERGWYPVPCPQEHLHTTGMRGDGSTGYKPSAGGGVFRCLHGHCKDVVTTDSFTNWLYQRDAAGFRASLAAALNATIDAAPEGESVRFRLQAGETPEQEARRVMIENYIHVETQNKYWSVKSHGLVERAAVDDSMTAILKRTTLLHVYSDATGNRLKDMPVQAWMRMQRDLPRVGGITHRLGQPLIIENCVNIAPPIPEPIEDLGDPVPWLDLVDMVFTSPKEAEQWLDWAAMVVTAWTEKPGWVPMLKGRPGAGKGMLLNPIKHYLDCSRGESHWMMVQPQELAGQFTYYAKVRLVIVEELKQIAHGTPHAVDIYTLMKKYTGRGNRMITVRDLNKSPYTALDLSAWSIYSNEHAPLPLEKGERRVAVFTTSMPKSDDYYLPIGNWIDGGGWRVVIGWLQERWNSMSEAERETVRGNAPMTAAKQEIIDISGGTLLGAAIRMCVSGRHDDPWPDLMTMGDIVNALSASGLLSQADTHRNLGEMAVSRALRNEGAVQLFDSKPVDERRIEYPKGRKMRLWCVRGEKAAEYEKLGQGKLMVDTYQAMRAPGTIVIGDNVTPFKSK